jgi:3D (Asp-Asp-Asp) domain-containing protein
MQGILLLAVLVAASAGWFEVEATAYTATCEGCTGTCKDGTPADWTKNIIAVDPRVISLGSVCEIEGLGSYTARDIGGAIKGNKIDILMRDREAALKWGRREVKVRCIEVGDEGS